MDNIKGKIWEVNSKNGKKTIFVKKKAKFFAFFRPAKPKNSRFFLLLTL